MSAARHTRSSSSSCGEERTNFSASQLKSRRRASTRGGPRRPPNRFAPRHTHREILRLLLELQIVKLKYYLKDN